MNIKENLSSEVRNLDTMIIDLDNWLASLSSRRLDRINPFQFSLELNYNERDCLRVFVEATKENLFCVKYEVRDDEDRYIGTLTSEQYKEFSRANTGLFMYSRFTDKNEEFLEHNVEIWFGILMKPTEVPGGSSLIKKQVAPPLTMDNPNNDIFKDLMGR